MWLFRDRYDENQNVVKMGTLEMVLFWWNFLLNFAYDNNTFDQNNIELQLVYFIYANTVTITGSTC